MRAGSKGDRGRGLLVGLLVVELRRITQAQDLAVGVAVENAVRSLRFQGDYRYIPGPRPISRCDTPARQTFKRFELESSASV